MKRTFHSLLQYQLSRVVIPRTTIDMVYDLGERIDNARILQNNQLRGIRTEMMMFNAPAKVTQYTQP